MKNESELKSKFMGILKADYPDIVGLRHEDVRTGGIPDTSLNSDRTSWIEFKHATPNFKSHGIQEDVCRRLAIRGYCRYLVYWELGERRETRIVHPNEVWRKKGKVSDMLIEASTLGFNHRWAIEYILRANHVRSTNGKS